MMRKWLDLPGPQVCPKTATPKYLHWYWWGKKQMTLHCRPLERHFRRYWVAISEILELQYVHAWRNSCCSESETYLEGFEASRFRRGNREQLRGNRISWDGEYRRACIHTLRDKAWEQVKKTGAENTRQVQGIVSTEGKRQAWHRTRGFNVNTGNVIQNAKKQMM